MFDIGLIAIYLIVVLVAVSIHESAHALMSYFLGDDTAKLQKRISLNPLNHIDPFMSVLLPVVLMMMKLPAFGGAKPVMVNSRKIKYGDYGMALVALAGPLSNFLLAFICFGGVALAVRFENIFWMELMMLSVRVNLGFMLFNLLPIPPLDGSRVLYALVPESAQEAMRNFECYGTVVIMCAVMLLSELVFAYVSQTGQLIINLFRLIFGL